jgi:hypothetical protein
MIYFSWLVETAWNSRYWLSNNSSISAQLSCLLANVRYSPDHYALLCSSELNYNWIKSSIFICSEISDFIYINSLGLTQSQSQSQSYLRVAVYRSTVHLGAKPLRLTTSICFFQPNICGYSPYVTSSLTGRCVCPLQLLLDLAIAVILESESCGAHGLILLSQIRDCRNLESGVPVFISHKRTWPSQLWLWRVLSFGI